MPCETNGFNEELALLILATGTTVTSGRAGDVETPLLREPVIYRMLEHDAVDSSVWDFPAFRDYDEYIW